MKEFIAHHLIAAAVFSGGVLFETGWFLAKELIR